MTQTPPRYFWLWHLAALKVIDADFGPLTAPPENTADSGLRAVPAPAITATRWDGLTGTATAALIDTGVSRTHPNLATRIDTARSIDLTSHRYGAQTLPPTPDTLPATREQKKAFFAGLTLSGLHPLHLDPQDLDYLEGMVTDYRGGLGLVRQLIDAEDTFAAHGTACAGLMVGEPAMVGADGAAVPPGSLTGSDINPDPNLLPYFGVDPFSTLLSIRTSFEADPYQFIAAFLYAWACKVDIIVLPRGLPDPVRSRLDPKEELKADLETWKSRHAADLYQRLHAAPGDPVDPNGAQEGSQPDRPWNILKHLIIAISRHIPVICAAGNDGESQVIYPANLADDDNGVIAVGAVTPEGFRAGYANYGDDLTLVAPSDDFEVYTRHQSRLNRADPLIDLHDYAVGEGKRYAFCPFDLVTTDLPGVFGYDGGTTPWSQIPASPGNPGVGGGYYTAFGGTSGAACLIGGLGLLAKRARRGAGLPDLDGLGLKAALIASCSSTAIVAPGTRPLTGDLMNADNENKFDVKYFFGAGLPDASVLIAAVIKP